MDEHQLKLLPEKFLKKWESGERDLIERHDELAVLYGDLVGFSVLSREISPSQTIHVLNDLIDLLDESAQKHQVVRVSTVGYHYMAMSYSKSAHQNVIRLLEFGLEIRSIVADYSRSQGLSIGQSSAVCVGGAFEGVVGRQQMKYDVWGEAINTAHFMSEYAESGELLISASVRERVGQYFTLEQKESIKDLEGLEVWKVIDQQL